MTLVPTLYLLETAPLRSGVLRDWLRMKQMKLRYDLEVAMNPGK